MSTQTERLIRSGEAIRDLAEALPDDLRVVTVHANGYDFGDRLDVEVLFWSLADGLRAVRVLGGIWRHTLASHEPGTDTVHHHWTGTLHGWSVQMVAIWDSAKIGAEEIAPLVGASGGDPS